MRFFCNRLLFIHTNYMSTECVQNVLRPAKFLSFWFLAWVQQVSGNPADAAAHCLQPGKRGFRKIWIPRPTAWHARWNFSSLLQFSPCSEKDTTECISCVFPPSCVTCPCIRAALLFKTIAPNSFSMFLGLEISEICHYFELLDFILSFRGKIKTISQFCVCVELVLLWGENISTSNRSIMIKTN